MSLAYYIVLDNDDPGFDTFVNGKALAHAVEELDIICAQAGLRKVDDFMGQSAEELADLLDEDVELPDGEASDAVWFDPEEGIALFDALGKAIKAHPETLRTPDAVLEDLAEYRDVLEKAKAIGARWHLAIDL